jgi:Ser/Thr protein kinase RdoA (MazF antagonist)
VEILNAVEGIGYQCDGRLMAMNSYENRVYHVGMSEGELERYSGGAYVTISATCTEKRHFCPRREPGKPD